MSFVTADLSGLSRLGLGRTGAVDLSGRPAPGDTVPRSGPLSARFAAEGDHRGTPEFGANPAGRTLHGATDHGSRAAPTVTLAPERLRPARAMPLRTALGAVEAPVADGPDLPARRVVPQ